MSRALGDLSIRIIGPVLAAVILVRSILVSVRLIIVRTGSARKVVERVVDIALAEGKTKRVLPGSINSARSSDAGVKLESCV